MNRIKTETRKLWFVYLLVFRLKEIYKEPRCLHRFYLWFALSNNYPDRIFYQKTGIKKLYISHRLNFNVNLAPCAGLEPATP